MHVHCSMFTYKVRGNSWFYMKNISSIVMILFVNMLVLFSVSVENTVLQSYQNTSITIIGAVKGCKI